MRPTSAPPIARVNYEVGTSLEDFENSGKKFLAFKSEFEGDLDAIQHVINNHCADPVSKRSIVAALDRIRRAAESQQLDDNSVRALFYDIAAKALRTIAEVVQDFHDDRALDILRQLAEGTNACANGMIDTINAVARALAVGASVDLAVHFKAIRARMVGQFILEQIRSRSNYGLGEVSIGMEIHASQYVANQIADRYELTPVPDHFASRTTMLDEIVSFMDSAEGYAAVATLCLAEMASDVMGVIVDRLDPETPFASGMGVDPRLANKLIAQATAKKVAGGGPALEEVYGKFEAQPFCRLVTRELSDTATTYEFVLTPADSSVLQRHLLDRVLATRDGENLMGGATPHELQRWAPPGEGTYILYGMGDACWVTNGPTHAHLEPSDLLNHVDVAHWGEVPQRVLAEIESDAAALGAVRMRKADDDSLDECMAAMLARGLPGIFMALSQSLPPESREDKLTRLSLPFQDPRTGAFEDATTAALLVAAGLPVDDVQWNALLKTMALRNNAGLVRGLLLGGAPVMVENESGQTVDDIAEQSNDQSVKAALDGYFACLIELERAIGARCLDRVQQLLSSGDISLKSRNRLGETPLVMAVKSGAREVVEWLVEAGADIHGRALNGMTAIDYAVEHAGLEMLWPLLHPRAYALPQALTDRIITRLANCGFGPDAAEQITRRLLDTGSKDNLIDSLCWLGSDVQLDHLHDVVVVAVALRISKILTYPYNFDASSPVQIVMADDAHGGRMVVHHPRVWLSIFRNAIQLMGASDRIATGLSGPVSEKIRQLLRAYHATALVKILSEEIEANNTAVIRLFVESGLDVCDENGDALLRIAVRCDDAPLAVALLRAGAPRRAIEEIGGEDDDEEARAGSRSGVGPRHDLHLAIKAHRPERVREILAEGNVHVDSRGIFGITPLMTAIRSGDAAMVRLLLDHGADINARDHKGQTALHVAFGNKELVGLWGVLCPVDYELTDETEALLVSLLQADLKTGAPVGLFGKLGFQSTKRIFGALQEKNYVAALMPEHVAFGGLVADFLSKKAELPAAFELLMPFTRFDGDVASTVTRQLLSAARGTTILHDEKGTVLKCVVALGDCDVIRHVLKMVQEEGVTRNLIDAYQVAEGLPRRKREIVNLFDTAFPLTFQFHKAIGDNDLIRVKEMLATGEADVGSLHLSGRTPLMSAAQAGDAGMVALLLENGAGKDLRTGDGRVAMDYAIESLQYELECDHASIQHLIQLCPPGYEPGEDMRSELARLLPWPSASDDAAVAGLLDLLTPRDALAIYRCRSEMPGFESRQWPDAIREHFVKTARLSLQNASDVDECVRILDSLELVVWSDGGLRSKLMEAITPVAPVIARQLIAAAATSAWNLQSQVFGWCTSHWRRPDTNLVSAVLNAGFSIEPGLNEAECELIETAAEGGNLSLVSFLMKVGMGKSAGWTRAYNLAMKNERMDVVIALDDNFPARFAFHHAILGGSLDEVKRLLARGQVTAVSTGMFDRTPLMTALHARKAHLVEFFMGRSSLTAMDMEGRRAFDYALKHVGLAQYWARLYPRTEKVEFPAQAIVALCEDGHPDATVSVVREFMDLDKKSTLKALLGTGAAGREPLEAVLGETVKSWDNWTWDIACLLLPQAGSSQEVRDVLGVMLTSRDWRPSCVLPVTKLLLALNLTDAATLRALRAVTLKSSEWVHGLFVFASDQNAPGVRSALLKFFPEAFESTLSTPLGMNFRLCEGLLLELPDVPTEGAPKREGIRTMFLKAWAEKSLSKEVIGLLAKRPQLLLDTQAGTTVAMAMAAFEPDTVGMNQMQRTGSLDLSATDRNGLVPLLHAVKAGNIRTMRWILDQMTDHERGNALGGAADGTGRPTVMSILTDVVTAGPGMGLSGESRLELLDSLLSYPQCSFKGASRLLRDVLSQAMDRQPASRLRAKALLTRLKETATRPNAIVRFFRYLFASDPYWLREKCMRGGVDKAGKQRWLTPMQWARKAGHADLRDLIDEVRKS